MANKFILKQLNQYFPNDISLLVKQYFRILDYKYEFGIKLPSDEQLMCIDSFDNILYVIIQITLSFSGFKSQHIILCDTYNIQTKKKLHRTKISESSSCFSSTCIIYLDNSFMWIWLSESLIKFNHINRKNIIELICPVTTASIVSVKNIF